MDRKLPIVIGLFYIVVLVVLAVLQRWDTFATVGVIGFVSVGFMFWVSAPHDSVDRK